LLSGLAEAREAERDDLAAEANHAIGTSAILQGNYRKAMQHLEFARVGFQTLNDKNGLWRTYANIAMAQGSQLNWRDSLTARRYQERYAREAKDELGIANALVGLSLVERNLGNLQRALTYALEADGMFERQNNLSGRAAALQNEANIYVRIPDYPKALDSANRAVTLFVESRDVRGVAATLGVLARAAGEVENHEDEVFALLASIGLRRYSGSDDLAAEKRDIKVFEGQLATLRERNERALITAMAAACSSWGTRGATCAT
jgi:tetratricopeptide (TPR) repeat protein